MSQYLLCRARARLSQLNSGRDARAPGGCQRVISLGARASRPLCKRLTRARTRYNSEVWSFRVGPLRGAMPGERPPTHAPRPGG